MNQRAIALALLTAAVSLASCQSIGRGEQSSIASREAADTIITGGTLYDGSGTPGEVGDIAIRGETIVYVGQNALARFDASRIVDARGLIVAPGFIDPHTHAGADLAADNPARRSNLAFAFQGVTTVVTGNDGFGGHHIAAMAGAATEAGIGTNVAYLVGFGSVREAVLGKANRPPEAAELTEMETLTRTAMCEGAWGLSAGLYYVPQTYAATDEVAALARVAGGLGGYYDTHLRDESTYNVTVTGALAEALQIGRDADLPVHIAHIKALGPAVWGHSAQMIAMVGDARANGQRVTADQYPWEASGTRISNALVPRWALEGGLPGLRERMADPEILLTIREDMVEAIARRGGAERLLVTGQLAGSNAAVGQTLAEIASQNGEAPVDAALAILREGDARLASFNMSADDIAAFAAQEWVVTGSDGSTGHPRKFGSFPKAYRDLVLGGSGIGEPGIGGPGIVGTGMDLARFIRRSSGQTADIIGLERRGYLKPGYFADVLVFDPASFAPNATYSAPRELSSGVIHLFVNGAAMIRDQNFTGTLTGRPLLKDTQC